MTDHEVISFCREHVANYKLPKQVVFMDSLPKTTTGRIIKAKLKEM